MTKFIDLKLDGEKEKGQKTFFETMVTDKDVLITPNNPDNYDNVMHLFTNEIYGSVFVAWDDDCPEHKYIYFGTKGDEFN